MSRSHWLTAAAALCLFAAACSPGAPRASTPPRPTTSTAPRAAASPSASPTAGNGALLTLGGFTYADYGTREMRGRKEQSLDAGAYYFKGTFLRGTPGQKVALSVRNVDQQLHNLSIPAFGVDLEIPIGKERYNAEITVPDSGALRFFCKLHADRGMNGQIISGSGEPQPLAGGPLQESW